MAAYFQQQYIGAGLMDSLISQLPQAWQTPGWVLVWCLTWFTLIGLAYRIYKGAIDGAYTGSTWIKLGIAVAVLTVLFHFVAQAFFPYMAFYLVPLFWFQLMFGPTWLIIMFGIAALGLGRITKTIDGGVVVPIILLVVWVLKEQLPGADFAGPDWLTAAFTQSLIPSLDLSLARSIDKGLDLLTSNFSDITRAISGVTQDGIKAFNHGLLWLWPPVLIAIIALPAWRVAGAKIGIFTVLGLLLLWDLNLWKATVETLTLVLISTLVAVALALPLGIMAAINQSFYQTIMPVLDFMQTMPAFVYLIPAIPFFGLGPVSAIFSTVIFAMPPAIRLSCLGIRQVPTELIEAADSFGSTKAQKLFKLQLPLATPTIMAGVNQTIMLALSMVVIAAMIGAKGLGGEVWRAIQRLQPGMGFQAGLGVVILAMILDRITQKIGRKNELSN